jgi:hypothetical protein
MRREAQGNAPVEDITHFTVQNRVDFTISSPEVIFEIGNFTA